MEAGHVAKLEMQQLFGHHVIGPAHQAAVDDQWHVDRLAHFQPLGLGGEQPGELHELAGLVLRAGQGGHRRSIHQGDVLRPKAQGPAPGLAKQHFLLSVKALRCQALLGQQALAADVARQHRADGGAHSHLVARTVTQPLDLGFAADRAAVVAAEPVAQAGGGRPVEAGRERLGRLRFRMRGGVAGRVGWGTGAGRASLSSRQACRLIDRCARLDFTGRRAGGRLGAGLSGGAGGQRRRRWLEVVALALCRG